MFRAFFESVIRHNRGENEFRWKCIFLPDNGAFFVNYVVTSALIGTALELMRLGIELMLKFHHTYTYLYFHCNTVP